MAIIASICSHGICFFAFSLKRSTNFIKFSTRISMKNFFLSFFIPLRV